MFSTHTIYSDQRLFLSNVEPFAEGVNRFCYVYPDDERLCVKVVKLGSLAFLRSKRSFLKNLRPDSYFDDNLNEYKAYQQPAIQKGGDRIYDHIPRCYGWQDTDIGVGLVLDYYKQSSGDACVTLEKHLHENGFTDEIEGQLNALADYLREMQLMTKNILPHNVVMAEDGRLKIIDGIGACSVFNVANFSKAAKARYIERRIERMFLRARGESGDKVKSWTETENAVR